jgi:hypothetical protein
MIRKHSEKYCWTKYIIKLNIQLQDFVKRQKEFNVQINVSS